MAKKNSYIQRCASGNCGRIHGLNRLFGREYLCRNETNSRRSRPAPDVLASHDHADAEKMPNFVVFISDDLGRLDTSIYGSADARTPTMERLARAGMTFENAYVTSPACCPNRFSLLTGLMPARHGAHPNHSQVKPGTEFLVPIVKQLGYHVATFGKVAHGRNNFPGADSNFQAPRNMSKNVGKQID